MLNRHSLLKTGVLALSLANLCFLEVWSDLLGYAVIQQDSTRVPIVPAANDYVAVFANIALLALVFWIPMVLVQHFQLNRLESAGRWLSLLILTIPLNTLRERFLGVGFQSVLALGPVMLLLLGTALFLLVLLRRDAVFTAVSNGLIVLSPLVLVMSGQVIWNVWTQSPRFAPPPPPAAPGAPSDRRVVWIIYDEFDESVAFSDRPADLELPNMDRFKNESIYATDAQPPSRETRLSVPSYLVGEVVDAVTVYPDDALLTFLPAKSQVLLSQVPNVFDKAIAMGYRTGVAGWYFPYCNLLPRSLSTCSWYPLDNVIEPANRSIYRSMAVQLQTLSLLGNRQQHLLRYRQVLADALAVVGDPALGLVLVHWPVPHAPAIYDRSAKEFTIFQAPDSEGYLGNLVVADDALERLRRQMEESDVWDKTAVIITADHAWRDAEMFGRPFQSRVPFMIKLPGQKEGSIYSEQLDAVIVSDLILRILSGSLSEASETMQWMRNYAAGEAEPAESIN